MNQWKNQGEQIPLRPTPLTCQSSAFRLAGLAVRTTMCCMSLHVRFLFDSRAKAQIPAASGADADVPLSAIATRHKLLAGPIYLTN